MINAKQEFIEHIKQHCLGGRTVRCAKIQFEYNYDDDDKPIMHVLPVGYTPEDLVLFLAEIDRNYNNGWGGQELYGTIWYTDGKTWSERGEYDGSEWWEFCEVPEITPELMGDADSKI